MKYKEQVRTRAEAMNNLLETLQRGLSANALSQVEAAAIIVKLKSLVDQIDSFTELE